MRRLIPLAALLTFLPEAGHTEEPAVETIVFATLRPSDWNVHLFGAAGEPAKPLTDDPDLDYKPAISPDGRYVVFCSERRGTPDLYLLDLERDGPPRPFVASAAMDDARRSRRTAAGWPSSARATAGPTSL